LQIHEINSNKKIYTIESYQYTLCSDQPHTYWNLHFKTLRRTKGRKETHSSSHCSPSNRQMKSPRFWKPGRIWVIALWAKFLWPRIFISFQMLLALFFRRNLQILGWIWIESESQQDLMNSMSYMSSWEGLNLLLSLAGIFKTSVCFVSKCLIYDIDMFYLYSDLYKHKDRNLSKKKKKKEISTPDQSRAAIRRRGVKRLKRWRNSVVSSTVSFNKRNRK
jgi:hypothetical protein